MRVVKGKLRERDRAADVIWGGKHPKRYEVGHGVLWVDRGAAALRGIAWEIRT